MDAGSTWRTRSRYRWQPKIDERHREAAIIKGLRCRTIARRLARRISRRGALRVSVSHPIHSRTELSTRRADSRSFFAAQPTWARQHASHSGRSRFATLYGPRSPQRDIRIAAIVGSFFNCRAHPSTRETRYRTTFPPPLRCQRARARTRRDRQFERDRAEVPQRQRRRRGKLADFVGRRFRE